MCVREYIEGFEIERRQFVAQISESFLRQREGQSRLSAAAGRRENCDLAAEGNRCRVNEEQIWSPTLHTERDFLVEEVDERTGFGQDAFRSGGIADPERSGRDSVNC